MNKSYLFKGEQFVFLLLSIAIVGLSADFGFFWDTINIARQADYFYEKGLTTFLVPTLIDTGHPPLFSWLLALTWQIGERSLLVSHFFMLPILWGIFWQFARLLDYFLSDNILKILGFLFLITEITFVGHSVLISPDLYIFLGFLMAANAILHRQGGLLAFGIFLQVSANLRGIPLSFALVLCAFLFYRKEKLTLNSCKWLFLSLFVSILTMLYYLWHYQQTGWLFSTPSENWGSQRGTQTLSGIFFNVVILAFKMVEYGKFLLLFAIAFLLRKNITSLRENKVFQIVLISALCFFPLLLISTNPIGNRYLLPFYALLNLWFVLTLEKTNDLSLKAKQSILVLTIILQMLGYTIIYPNKMAQAWDATPAHWSYYALRNEAIKELNERKLKISQVATEFPNKEIDYYYNLTANIEKWQIKDLKQNTYFLYSNVMNDLTDSEIDELNKQEQWRVIWQKSRRGIAFILYEKRK